MKILNEFDYQEAFLKIDKLISSDFESSEKTKNEFRELAIAIQDYEKEHYPLRLSESGTFADKSRFDYHQQ